MENSSSNFNNAVNNNNWNWNDILMHMLIIIPIEFGILHSTPLGPMLSGWFESLWSNLGVDFATQAASHIATEASTQTASHAFCHFHGSELVCH